MVEPALVLEALEVRYGAVSAVRDLSLEIGEGEIVGLIGPNGAGKSTTLHAIMGAVPWSRGEVRLRGTSLRGRKPEVIARSGIALVPEGRRVYAHFTVDENLRLGLAGRRTKEGSEADIRSAYELFPALAGYRARNGGRALGRATATTRDRTSSGGPADHLAP